MTEEDIVNEEVVLQNANLKALIHQIRLIDYVLQVRWWPVLKQRLKTQAGSGAISVNVYVKERQDFDNDRYTQLSTVFPEQVWNDPEQHAQAVANITETVQRYVSTGVIATGY